MKALCTATVCSLLMISVRAQTGLHIGGGIMPQQTWMINQDDSEAPKSEFVYVTTYGLAYTGKLGFNFGPPLGLHSGAIFSMQGQKNSYVDSASGNTVETYRKLNYLKIPVYLHVTSASGNPRDMRGVLMSLGIGLYYSMLREAHVTDDGVPKYEQALANAGLEDKDLYAADQLGITWYLGTDIRLAENWLWFNAHLRGDYSFGDAEEKLLEVNSVRWYQLGRPFTNNFNWGINLGFTIVAEVGQGSGKGGQFWFR